MTLWVLHEDGNRELISLVPPLSFIHGVKLDRLISGDGTEHWFTKDGYYDGWGRVMSGASPAESDALIEGMEATRHIESGDQENES